MKTKLIYLFLLATFCLSLLASKDVIAQSNSIFINEFMPDPSGTDSGKEWIELYNANSTTFSISGWKIKNISASGSIRTIDLGNITVAPHSYLVLADSVQISATNIVYLSLGAVNLFNTNSRIELYDGSNVLVETVNYTNTDENKSWERKGPQCIDLVKNSSGNSLESQNINYDSSCWPIEDIPQDEPVSYPDVIEDSPSDDNVPDDNDEAPTEPTEDNPEELVDEAQYKIILTEIYPSPNTGEKEWIEIYNPTDIDIDLSNYKIMDINSDNIYIRNYLLSGILNSNSYESFENLGISLNNTGDQIGLFYKNELIDEVKYPSITKGKSFSRLANSSEYLNNWFETSKITKRAVNVSNEVPKITISNLKTSNTHDKFQIKGCITLVRQHMPDNYTYIQDNSGSIKVKLLTNNDLYNSDCLNLIGKLIITSKDIYFLAESMHKINTNYIYPAITLEKDSKFEDFEGMLVSYKKLIVSRKYSTSLLLENNLKMKYPDDFDSNEYESKEAINLEGIIIKISGVYYISPINIQKYTEVLGDSVAKTQNFVIPSYPLMKINSVNNAETQNSKYSNVQLWPIYLLSWLMTNLLFCSKYLLSLKIKLENFIQKRVKYLNDRNHSYFGKEIFDRNFSKKIPQTQSYD